MKGYKNILLAIAFIFSVGILRGQNISYKLYTPHDGLAQSQVTCLFQDSRGYIWVGTKGGISYFNGKNFQSLTAKDGLPSSSIWQIQEDTKGNIWFYAGKWFCKYDGKNLYSDTANVRALDGRFFLDNTQTAWCINDRDKLIYQSKDFKNWECVSNKDKNLANKTWRHLAYDKKEERLILRSMDLHVYAYKKGNLTSLSQQRGIWFQHSIAKNGEINYGTWADSIFLLQKDSITFVKKTNHISPIDVIRRPNGKIYFITVYGKNLYTLNDKNSIDSFPLNVTSTISMFEDKEKNMWIGTEEGLMRIYLDGFKNFKKEDLGGVWSMVEDTEGGMWFGDYYGHKLRRYNGKKIVEKTINYALLPNFLKGDLGDFYFGGDKDKLGNLYFPSIMGIKKWDGKRFSVFTPYVYGNDDHNVSLNFYLDTVRNIIISGTKGGFNFVSLQNGVTKYYGQEKGVYAPGFLLGVTKDGKGKYWLSAGNGVSVFDIDSDSVIKTYTPQNKNFSYFSSCTIFGDIKGNIWAGSAQGLLRYDEKGDTFALVAKNVIQSAVSALKGYKDQYLVIGATDGMYFLDLKAFYTEGGKEIVRCFNQNNGYLGIEPNQNCIYVDSKDNVWVAASDIVTKITPSELDMVQKPLTPYITTINNDRIPYESYQQTISLPYGINTAKIFFEAVGFERPFNTEFSYKLDDEKWSDWRVEDFAVLDNLSSGAYTFFVRTRPAGTTNESDIKVTYIRFQINVPFYRQAYFPIIAALSLLLLGFVSWFLIRQEQDRKAKDKKEHQAYIEQQEVLNKERNRQMQYLRIQTLQAQLNPHFIFNVLQAIQTRIYEGSRDTASGLIVDLSNLIRRFLESSVNMDISKMRNSEITLKQEINLLRSYIEFEQLQYSNKFDYDIHVDEDIETENVQVPPMLIQPYVENAIKHGILYEKDRRCRLDVRFSKNDDDMLICTITDNGVGRQKAKIIQDSYIRMYKSRGTQILEDRIKIMQELGHGIGVETHDNPEGGTIVVLKIDM